jgi:hypothetical protein
MDLGKSAFGAIAHGPVEEFFLEASGGGDDLAEPFF